MEEKNCLICDTPVRFAGKSVLGVLKYAWRRFLIIFTRLILMLNYCKLIVLIKKIKSSQTQDSVKFENESSCTGNM